MAKAIKQSIVRHLGNGYDNVWFQNASWGKVLRQLRDSTIAMAGKFKLFGEQNS